MQCTLTANPVTTTYNISKNLVITLKNQMANLLMVLF